MTELKYLTPFVLSLLGLRRVIMYLLSLIALFFSLSFFCLGVSGRKKCNNLIEQQTPRWQLLASFPLWFACLWLVCNYGISRCSLRGRSSSSSTFCHFFLTLCSAVIYIHYFLFFCIMRPNIKSSAVVGSTERG